MIKEESLREHNFDENEFAVLNTKVINTLKSLMQSLMLTNEFKIVQMGF